MNVFDYEVKTALVYFAQQRLTHHASKFLNLDTQNMINLLQPILNFS